MQQLPDIITPIRKKVRSKTTRLKPLQLPTRTEDADLALVSADLRKHRKIGRYRFTHVANERKNEKERNRCTAHGTNTGVPDLFIFVPFTFQNRLYSGLAIELKRAWPEPHKVSSDQAKWIKELNIAGWFALVCEGYDEATFVIEKFYSAR